MSSENGGGEVVEITETRRLRWTKPRGLHAPIAGGDSRETTWLELVEMLSKFRRTKAKEDAGCWCPATFLARDVAEAEAQCCAGQPIHLLDKKCRLRGKDAVARKTANVLGVSLLVVDVDEGGKEALAGVVERLQKRGVRHWWHTTHTSADRFRVVVPLSEMVPAERWWDVWHWGLKALGARASADPACKDASRLYYLPATALERIDEGDCGGAKSGRFFDVEKLYELGPWPDQPRRLQTSAPSAKEPVAKAFPPASETVLWAAAQDLEKHGDAIEGQHGDSRTYVAAAILTNDWGLSLEEAWPLLQAWNLKHARPVWSDEELHEKLENSGAYANGEFGARRKARTPYQLEVARVEAELELMLGTSQTRTSPASWKPVDELLGEEFPAADWLIQGLLARDTLTIIGADPKASKTWCLLELATAIATGGKAFGEFRVTEAAPVLLFLNEDSMRSVRNRFRALAAGHGLDPWRLSKVAVRTREPLDLCDRTQLAQLIVDVRMAPEKPALIGLDPLRNLHSAEENSSTEMSAVLRALGAIRKLCGCALAVVHHSAKSGGADDKRSGGARLRGSSAIDGYRDGLISLTETDKESAPNEISNQVAVDLKAFRGAGTFKLTLEIEDDEQGEAIRARWVRGEAAPKKQKRSEAVEEKLTLREEVAKKSLGWFRRRHAAAVRAGQAAIFAQGSTIQELVASLPSTKATVTRALDWLEETGKIIREPAPQTTWGKGDRVRWNLRLADDATVAQETSDAT